MRLNSIQILRFLAAALVVAVHVSQLSVGFVGVDIFFVISGFIIAAVLPGKSFGQFARDRFTRIFPIYWLCVLLRFAEVLPFQGWSLARAATSLTLWPITNGFVFPYLVVGWTLSFELLFYAAAGLTLLNRRAAPLLGIGYVVASALAFITGWSLFAYLGSPLIVEFLFGVVIAKVPFRSKPIGAIAIPAAIALIVAASTPSLGIPENIIGLAEWQRPIVWGLPAAMLVWGVLQFESHLRGRVASWVGSGGDASYSIYLSHPLMLGVALTFAPAPLAFIWLLILGLAVHRYVERPLLRWLRRNQSRQAEVGDGRQPSNERGSNPGRFRLALNRLRA